MVTCAIRNCQKNKTCALRRVKIISDSQKKGRAYLGKVKIGTQVLNNLFFLINNKTLLQQITLNHLFVLVCLLRELYLIILKKRKIILFNNSTTLKFLRCLFFPIYYMDKYIDKYLLSKKNIDKYYNKCSIYTY